MTVQELRDNVRAMFNLADFGAQIDWIAMWTWGDRRAHLIYSIPPWARQHDLLRDNLDAVVPILWTEEGEYRIMKFTVRKLREGEVLWERRHLPSAVSAVTTLYEVEGEGNDAVGGSNNGSAGGGDDNIVGAEDSNVAGTEDDDAAGSYDEQSQEEKNKKNRKKARIWKIEKTRKTSQTWNTKENWKEVETWESVKTWKKDKSEKGRIVKLESEEPTLQSSTETG